MPKPGRRGLIRLLWAANYSWRGLAAALKGEAAFRQELAAVAVLAPIGVWVGRTGVERSLLLGSLLCLLVVELLNSALESVVDRVGEEWHELSGRAKDMGSAAVLLAIVAVVVTWGAIIGDRSW
jgi:diacylglycerol kinase (ATP)